MLYKGPYCFVTSPERVFVIGQCSNGSGCWDSQGGVGLHKVVKLGQTLKIHFSENPKRLDIRIQQYLCYNIRFVVSKLSI